MAETPGAPAPHLLASLAGLSTPIIGDSQDRFGLPSGLRPMWPNRPFAAPARTVLTAPGDNQGIHEALEEIPPGHVLVVDGGGLESRALVGELIAEKAKALGVVALVIDGAVRDLNDLAAVGVPVYARSVNPAGPWKSGPYRTQVPVCIGGVVVTPGDIVVGDSDGLAVVRADSVERVCEIALGRIEAEARKRASNRRLVPRE